MNTILGIDLGTQNLKCVFYDFENRTLAAVASAPLAVDRDNQGKAEQQAKWWLDALAACMQQVDKSIRQSVKAIAVSGQQHGFVPLDKHGQVLAPVKLWCDTATQQEVDAITAECGGREQAIVLTGNPVLAGYTSPKIRWLKNHHPDLYKRMAHILLPHDYLNYVLTGSLAMEYGDASGTGLLDVRTRQWSAAMLKAVDSDRALADCLPPLHGPEQVIGTTSRQAASAYGLPEGIPVATGGGDNMMSAIGTGNVKAGELTISLGSSGTLYAYADKPVVDPAGHIAAFCSSTGGWLPLLCTMNCTLATELMRIPLAITLAEFDTLAAQAPAGADGLVALPFFNGERTPDLPNARATLFGLTSHNCTRAHLLRATIEGTCFALKAGLDALGRVGLTTHEIILTGGGSNSQVWRQTVADIFQLPVIMQKGEEGASFGAALQALWVLQLQEGASVDIANVCDEHLVIDHERCMTPDHSKADIYQSAYAQYSKVLQHLTPLLENR
jgi:xylulokinase